jgi:ribA/ribD-fused uncharacterized protein
MPRNSSSDVTRRDGFVLFWDGYLSNWHPSPFTVNGTAYINGEQWMMAEKARLFDDKAALSGIMKSTSPHEMKMIYGRNIKPYDDAKWKAVSRDRVYIGLLEKFRQNPDLKTLLLETGNDTIVEASPQDALWGIGLAADHPDAANPARWRGQNWLGEVLMRVRETLRKQ